VSRGEAGVGTRGQGAGEGAAPPRLWLFGVPVDAVTRETALDRAVSLVEHPLPGRAALVFTPNPEAVVEARRDHRVRTVLATADLALPDGVGVVWAAARCGRPLPARVPGVDFMQDLLAAAAARRWPVYLLGARPGVAAEAAARARQRYPGLQVAGTAHGYFPAAEEAAVVARIRDSGARLLFVGLGGARQHDFLYRHRAALGEVRLAMAVGGSLDVLAGVVRRAPRLVRRLGLEWLWRLLREPRRWRRQLALPRFALAVLAAGPAACGQSPGTAGAP
jgi:N-acetylglucosaminyldiphosphoundecaprenol N-acetyl-beta-D-mannosaminyltransferase